MKLRELISVETNDVKLLRPYTLKSGLTVESVRLDVLRGSHEADINKTINKYSVQKTLTRMLKLLTKKFNSVVDAKNEELEEFLDKLYDDDKLLLLLGHYCISFAEIANVSDTCKCGRKHEVKLSILDFEVDMDKLALPTSKSVTLKDGIEFDGNTLLDAIVNRPSNIVYDSLDTENPLKMQRQLLYRTVAFEDYKVLPERLFDSEMTSRDKNTLIKAISGLVGALNDFETVECDCGEKLRVAIPLTQFVVGE